MFSKIQLFTHYMIHIKGMNENIGFCLFNLISRLTNARQYQNIACIHSRNLDTCSHHRSTRIWRRPSHLHRPVGAPHRYATTISIWIRRTPRELRNTIARRHCGPIKHGGTIWGSTPTNVHRRRRPWAHVTPRRGIVGRSLHWLLHGLQYGKQQQHV
jgi:hypothetical protein